MESNPVLDTLLLRASVRRYQDKPVPDEVIDRIMTAGRQAPFAGQMYSAVVITDKAKRERIAESFGPMVMQAPVFVLVCLDLHKLDLFVAAKGRHNRAGNLGLLWLGLQDASYFAENIVIAAESLGLGSVFLGGAPWESDLFDELCGLPQRVFPMVGLLLGYPSETPPPRPRIPERYVWFREQYRDLTAQDVDSALQVMDAGLLREGYYARLNARIQVEDVPEEKEMGYDRYGWGEHVSRKYGAAGWTRESFMEALKRKGMGLE